MCNLIVCPKCNKVISYNSHFSAYICNNCDYVERCGEKDNKSEESVWLHNAFEKQERIEYAYRNVDKMIDEVSVGDTFVYLPMKENALVFRLVRKCEEIVKNGNAEEIQKTYVILNLLTGELKEYAQQDFPPIVFLVKVFGDKKDGA